MICVDETTFRSIEMSLSPLPKDLMRRLFQSSYKHHYRYDFAAIICDQTTVLAIDTLAYDFPLLKSRLTSLKEKQVLTMCQSQKPSRYPVKQSMQKQMWFHLVSHELIGLTRKERELKALLLFMFEQLEKNGQVEALNYFTTLYYRLKKVPAKRFGPIFLQEIKTGFTSVHEELIKNMLPLGVCYRELYEEAIIEEAFEHFQY